ncbi:maleylpyruvate isomerase N-terminal domain-containing protein [Streptomyces sp900116325]|uniref:maleylpyruvate isomerase N-terminal domain-containing protein n=1 Tax=Streptomyces sp. 900116325 TaxID=3154295 RepID=UPI00331C3E3B
MEFPVLPRLIDERSVAFRAAVASAPSLEVQVPTCPGWTLLDLVQHLGERRRFRAPTVAAGPADAPPCRGRFGACLPPTAAATRRRVRAADRDLRASR